MPKKTKKEKIIAYYRRKLKLLKQTPTPSPSPSALKKNSTPRPVSTTSMTEPITPQETRPIYKEKQIFPFFLSDLKKSIILSATVIVLEILIYFVRIIK